MAVLNNNTKDRLINIVRERPALYDITEKTYSNRVVKTELWREIENKLVILEKELKKRWKSLQTQYALYQRLAPLGSAGAQRTGRQEWILARLLLLEPHTKRKESTSNLTLKEPLMTAADSDSPSDGTNSEAWTSTPEEPCIDVLRPTSPLAESTICESTRAHTDESSSTSCHESIQRRWAKHSRKMLDESMSEGLASLMRTIGKTLETLASQQKKDDISVYCKNIEYRLRKLPRHLLPHFQHEVGYLLYRYSVDRSLATTRHFINL